MLKHTRSESNTYITDLKSKQTSQTKHAKVSTKTSLELTLNRFIKMRDTQVKLIQKLLKNKPQKVHKVK